MKAVTWRNEKAGFGTLKGGNHRSGSPPANAGGNPARELGHRGGENDGGGLLLRPARASHHQSVGEREREEVERYMFERRKGVRSNLRVCVCDGSRGRDDAVKATSPCGGRCSRRARRRGGGV